MRNHSTGIGLFVLAAVMLVCAILLSNTIKGWNAIKGADIYGPRGNKVFHVDLEKESKWKVVPIVEPKE